MKQAGEVHPRGAERVLDIHVVPMNDLREHIEALTCWCMPRCEREGEDAAVVVIHAAADGRDLVEQHGVN